LIYFDTSVLVAYYMLEERSVEAAALYERLHEAARVAGLSVLPQTLSDLSAPVGGEARSPITPGEWRGDMDASEALV